MIYISMLNKKNSKLTMFSSYFKMEQIRSVKSFGIAVSSQLLNGDLSVLRRVIFRHKLSNWSVYSRIRSNAGCEETADRDSSFCSSVCQHSVFWTDELVVCYKLHQTNQNNFVTSRDKSEQKALIDCEQKLACRRSPTLMMSAPGTGGTSNQYPSRRTWSPSIWSGRRTVRKAMSLCLVVPKVRSGSGQGG